MPDPDIEQIREALSSRAEAMAYFTVTPVGSAAFLLRTGDRPLTHMLLDELTEDKLVEQIKNYLNAYGRWRANPLDFDNRSVWFNTMDSTSSQLWDWLMGPLTEKLLESGISRAILIPQGLLGLLPLHAAWTEKNEKHRYALEQRLAHGK